jgi:hypothetical protein
MDIDRSEIREHMEVVAADGRHMGNVDHIDGDRITLAKNSVADGQHHFVKLVDVEAIRDGKVWLQGQAPVN